MPLDVQPLSKTRRALMVGVLIALFGASMGFAQLLIMRKPVAARANWNFPPELNRPFPEPPVVGVELARSGFVNGHKRAVVALRFDIPVPANRELRLERAREIFTQLIEVEPSLERNAKLANKPAIELQGLDEDGDFAVLRMAVAKHHAFAICYRGGGKLTDADKSYFDRLCQRVEIHEDPSSTRK
jgi:hypothetical protein